MDLGCSSDKRSRVWNRNHFSVKCSDVWSSSSSGVDWLDLGIVICERVLWSSPLDDVRRFNLKNFTENFLRGLFPISRRHKTGQFTRELLHLMAFIVTSLKRLIDLSTMIRKLFRAFVHNSYALWALLLLSTSCLTLFSGFFSWIIHLFGNFAKFFCHFDQCDWLHAAVAAERQRITSNFMASRFNRVVSTFYAGLNVINGFCFCSAEKLTRI